MATWLPATQCFPITRLQLTCQKGFTLLVQQKQGPRKSKMGLNHCKLVLRFGFQFKRAKNKSEIIERESLRTSEEEKDRCSIVLEFARRSKSNHALASYKLQVTAHQLYLAVKKSISLHKVDVHQQYSFCICLLFDQIFRSSFSSVRVGQGRRKKQL